MKVLRIKQVEAATGLSRSTIYAMMSTGTFPKPITLTGNRVGWIESEVMAWLETRISRRDAQATPEAA